MSRISTIQSALRGRRFEVPLIAWPSPWLVDSGDLPENTEFELLIRGSAQVYNYLGQYKRLASILARFAAANRAPAASTQARLFDRARACGIHHFERVDTGIQTGPGRVLSRHGGLERGHGLIEHEIHGASAVACIGHPRGDNASHRQGDVDERIGRRRPDLAERSQRLVRGGKRPAE